MRLVHPLLLVTILLAPAATLAQSMPAQSTPVQAIPVQAIPAKPPPRSGAAGTTAPAPPVRAPALTATLTRDAALTRGRQLVTWFYAQNLGPVWAAFQPAARASFGDDLNTFKAYRSSGVTTYGKETRLLGEEVMVQDGVSYYLRSATFERGPKVIWTVAFGLDNRGQVVNFGILGGTEPDPGQGARGAGGAIQ